MCFTNRRTAQAERRIQAHVEMKYLEVCCSFGSATIRVSNVATNRRRFKFSLPLSIKYFDSSQRHSYAIEVTFKLTPSLGLNTNRHIFKPSGSSVVASFSKLYILNKQQRIIFISVSANLRPTQPLGPCKNVMKALVVYVSGSLSQRSGLNCGRN